MKLLNALALLTTLTMIAGCGEDLSSNRKRGRGGIQPVKPGTNQLLNSQMHRLRGFRPLTYLEEIENTLGNTMRNVYHIRPVMALDDEGANGENVISMSSIGRPAVACGIGANFTGIDARLSDCARKNPDHSQWSGVLFGNSGEGTWRLVARSADSKEIWLDVHSGMVWSDVIDTVNWCKASGNSEGNCADLGEGVSVCQGLTVAGLGTNVRWRLPSRNDYLQADLNGIRAVLKKTAAAGVWTATIRSKSAQAQAWTYALEEGILSGQDLSEERAVHCIGTPVR